MFKYTVKKGDDGKYKLSKKDDKPVKSKDKDDVDSEVLAARLSKMKGKKEEDEC